MLMQGDFDMNSVHAYTDSLKEALKHTMLNQEVIFRNQVHELHHLYMVQITLMKNLGCKEFDRYISGIDSAQSSLMPPINLIRDVSLLKETRLSTIPMVNEAVKFCHVTEVASSRSLSQELSGEWGMDWKLQQMSFDLQLPADLYSSLADKDFPNKRNVLDLLKDTSDSCAGNISDAVDLTLSLSLGEDSRRREGAKKTISCPQAVINLEDSTEGINSNEVEHAPSLGCIPSITSAGGKLESHESILSDPTTPSCVKQDISHNFADSSSIVNSHQCCQEQHAYNQEIKESKNDSQCNYMSLDKHQKLASYEARVMDLNNIDLNDSSYHSNDPMVTYPSTGSSSGGYREIVGKDKEESYRTTIWRKEINDCSNETSGMCQQDVTVNFALTNPDNKNKITELWHSDSKLSGVCETEASVGALKSVFGLPMDLCEEHGSCCSDLKSKKDKSMSESRSELLNDLNNTCEVATQVSCEMSEVEDTVYLCSGRNQNPGQDKHENKSSASYMSCCTVDNVPKTTESGIEAGNSSIPPSDQLSETCMHSQVAKILSGGQDQRSPNCSEFQQEFINDKEETAKQDILVQSAAESLISMLNSACSQDYSTRTGSNEIINEESEQPQSSSDSFELIALKLTESSSGDFSVSSKPFELNDVDKNNIGVKWRRGRRMKDFQKDILPVLVSLSRHEICEDINIMEGVLRSKEYRKNRAKLADEESWCLPSKSRRTRYNYTRQRNFL
ncbi:hypothetical protein Patl1_18541 [Pistacia atlantica]|uniref:Uncharacterized protein n=1 Tax=Pistacia atlantica TaxID=434234 RepID=A0ACC1C024_9ROSI|nr:hypothetical protein Patl1_18541 [Pistacia atlantica]